MAAVRPLPPLRLCPHHGVSFRSWKEGAMGPCCLGEDRTRPANANDLVYAEALGGSLLAYQRSLALELAPGALAKRRRVGGPLAVEL